MTCQARPKPKSESRPKWDIETFKIWCHTHWREMKGHCQKKPISGKNGSAKQRSFGFGTVPNLDSENGLEGSLCIGSTRKEDSKQEQRCQQAATVQRPAGASALFELRLNRKSRSYTYCNLQEFHPTKVEVGNPMGQVRGGCTGGRPQGR